MLSKIVCQKCKERLDFYKIFETCFFNFEKAWKMNFVYCPRTDETIRYLDCCGKNKRINISLIKRLSLAENPPEKCPYKLEHVIECNVPIKF